MEEVRPPSLREVLDAGCDLTEMGIRLDGLAEVLSELPTMPPGVRAERAAQGRYFGERLLEGEEVVPFDPVARVQRESGLESMATLEFWIVELLEHPDLVERVWKALPAEMAEEHRHLQDCIRRPHPLDIRVPDHWWSCASCGAAFDLGEEEAVVVSGRQDYSDMDPITYCRHCIAIAAQVLGGGTQPL